MAMHRNVTIKKEIAKRNSKAKHRFTTSRYLSKTMPMKTNNTSTHRSSNIHDALTQIRIKYGSLTILKAQNEIKIKICNAMNQLNDIDSRSVGLSILHNIIDSIPDKLLHLIIEPFFSINNDLKALCRKEIVLLIGYIGSKRGNTQLFYKHLNKLLINLCKRAQDSDSRVREACGDSFSRITKQTIRYTQLNNKNCFECINKIIKPIIKIISKNISPQSITGNFLCLSNVILSSDNYLNISHIIIICKCIISNIINIRNSKTHCSLLICIEKLMIVATPLISSTTKNEINNNNTENNNTDYFSALLAIIIDGLSNSDWNVRNYSLKAIYAIGIVFINVENKTEINKNKLEIIAHLERLKYDKISNVRNTAIMTLSIWNDINCDDLNSVMELNNKLLNININSDNDENEFEEIDDLRTKQIVEKPWFDKNENGNENKNDDKKDFAIDENNNSNALILQQQQLMLKTMKNLELYIHKEISDMKSRIHCVERDMQTFKINYQNNQWINENKKLNQKNIFRPKTANNIISQKKNTMNDEYNPSNIDTIAYENNTEFKDIDIEENDNNIMNNNNTTVDISETISIYSDETRMLDLNEQLLNIIQMDNNIELIQWLIQNNNYSLFQIIDERLMISLIYRITQLLKDKKYINDISDFLKKEFIIGNQKISNQFKLPKQLKNEFLNTIKQFDNMNKFVSQISNLI